MKNKNFFVAGVGASAGGQQALKDFFSNLSSDTGVCYCVVTHLHRSHRSILDRILSKCTNMPVVRINGGEPMTPDTVFVLPEGMKVFAKNGTFQLQPRLDEEVVNRTVDEFFISLAEDRKEKAIGIILSGMGDDGARGVEMIHEHGGMVLVQDPRSTAFRSMPENAIDHDHPESILPPAALAKGLMDAIRKRVVEKQSTD